MTAVVEVIENPVTVIVDGETVTIESVTETAAIEIGASGPQGIPGPHLPTFTATGDLSPTTGTNRYYVEAACTINFIRAAVGTAPTGADVVVGINVNGVQESTATISAGDFTGTNTVNVALLAGDYLTVDILTVGSTVAGANLTVTLTIS